MKGYYKNWYQHYLELEEQKAKDEQRGYYSNLAPKTKEYKAEKQVSESRKEEKSTFPEGYQVVPVKKKKRKFRLLSVILPVATILGFLFLWYQLDVGPIRHVVHEALVFAGIRNEAVDVMCYHTDLLDQHVDFADKVAAYISGEDGFSLEDLELLYHEIRAAYIRVLEVSKGEYAETARLWSFKILSTNQMMRDLRADDGVDEAYAQFVSDQEKIATMIREELMIGEDL